MPAALASSGSGSILRIATVLLLCGSRREQDWLAGELEDQGLRVLKPLTIKETLDSIRHDYIQLLVIDDDCSELKAAAICDNIRRESRATRLPILVLSSHANENDQVRALDTGADDYVIKPFSIDVLVARIATLLRRWAPHLFTQKDAGPTLPLEPGEEDLHVGPLLIFPRRHQAYHDRRPLDLTFLEFRLLTLLAGSPGEVFSREAIYQELYQGRDDVSIRAVDSLVFLLRKKLSQAANLIQTVRGQGYLLDTDAQG
jgi:DNA-binding response OmpR family regulator